MQRTLLLLRKKVLEYKSARKICALSACGNKVDRILTNYIRGYARTAALNKTSESRVRIAVGSVAFTYAQIHFEKKGLIYLPLLGAKRICIRKRNNKIKKIVNVIFTCKKKKKNLTICFCFK